MVSQNDIESLNLYVCHKLINNLVFKWLDEAKDHPVFSMLVFHQGLNHRT